MKMLHVVQLACCLGALHACSPAPKRVPAGLPPPEYEAPRVGVSTGGGGGEAAGLSNAGGATLGGSEANPPPQPKPLGTE